MAANYDDLPVHPLIKGLAVGLDDPKKPNFPGAKAAAVAAQAAAWKPPAAAVPKDGDPVVENFPDAQGAEVVVFAGYLGPAATNPVDKTTWRFLYQDAKAMSWLLVPQDDVVLHDRAPDKKAAFQLRDVIWVRADAPVRQGEEAEEKQARFLVGTFTKAGDLHATLIDASAAPPGSGILCAPTPECCPRYTR